MSSGLACHTVMEGQLESWEGYRRPLRLIGLALANWSSRRASTLASCKIRDGQATLASCKSNQQMNLRQLCPLGLCAAHLCTSTHRVSAPPRWRALVYTSPRTRRIRFKCQLYLLRLLLRMLPTPRRLLLL